MLPALDAIARTTAFGAAPIVISGHTDGDPISTQRFRSNWDLSAARAISVLHYFVGTGLIDPNRLSAIGYAETKPMADEDTARGKALNRRVEIRIAQTDK
jgi:chemotaxis protein MotB